MSLRQYRELHQFLSTYFSESEAENDLQTVQKFIDSTSAPRQQEVLHQAKLYSAEPDLSLEDLGTETNRWFGEVSEAHEWLRQIIHALESAQTGDAVIVKDSNGAELHEGDSVQVIKDLQVKGGSSDLKRGTLIKKIHLINDPDNIECRVGGSTLVLKTCFLKKV